MPEKKVFFPDKSAVYWIKYFGEKNTLKPKIIIPVEQ